MGLTNQERINFTSKVLAAKVIDNNQVAQWYESKFQYSPNISSKRVLIDFQLFLDNPASTLTEARNNVANNLFDVCIDYSSPINAIRLTNVVGTNNTTWVAKSVYGDLGSQTINDWIQPQAIPQLNGSPSFGYAIKLYDGNPSSGGVEITTTDGSSGSGPNASVGWVWNYDLGLLFLSDDFKSTISDPYVLGFVYDGRYLSDIDLSGDTGNNTFTGLTDTEIITPNDGDILIYSGNTVINTSFKDIYFTTTANEGVQTIILNFVGQGYEYPTTNFAFYVNGVRQIEGNANDYYLSGTELVWTGNKHSIDTNDILEIIYI